MMGSSTAQVISGLDTLAKIAEVISDPDRLKALRDEFQNDFAANQELEKQVADRVEQAKSLENTNKSILLDLEAKAVELSERESKLKEDVDTLKINNEAVTAAVVSVQERENVLQRTKAEFSQVQKSAQLDLENIKQKNQADLDAREANVTARENSIALREQTLISNQAAFDAKVQRLSQAMST